MDEEARGKQIEDLNTQIEASLKESQELNRSILLNLRGRVETSVGELLLSFSSEVRNMRVLSGTVAPFSLALLAVAGLNISIPALLSGFCLLLLNIILIQLYLQFEADKQFGHTIRSEMNLGMAELDNEFLTRNSPDSVDRVSKSLALYTSINSIQRSLTNTLNPESLKARARLKKFSRISTFLFVGGVFLIALSVIINPVCNWIILNTPVGKI